MSVRLLLAGRTSSEGLADLGGRPRFLGAGCEGSEAIAAALAGRPRVLGAECEGAGAAVARGGRPRLLGADCCFSVGAASVLDSALGGRPRPLFLGVLAIGLSSVASGASGALVALSVESSMATLVSSGAE